MKLLVGLAVVAACAALRVMDSPAGTEHKEFDTPDGPVTLVVGKKRGRAIDFNHPSPFEVKSKFLHVTDTDKDESLGRRREGRQFQQETIEDGIPVIEGVREPDDPNDTKVYRNARVINNILVTEDDEQGNQIPTEVKTNSRQGRILTGSSAPQRVPQGGSERQESAFHQQNFYNPDRSGPVAPDSKKPADEKVVSYSYSTSVSEPEKKSGNDVVYGTGFAENPKGSPDSRIHEVKPPITWSNFHSSPEFLSSTQRLSSSGGNSGSFKFPSNQESPASSFSHPNPNVAQRSPVQRFQQGSGVSSGNRQFHRNPNYQSSFHHEPTSSYSSVYGHTNSIYNNQIRRQHQQAAIPTPHQAFGGGGSNHIHPSIIPADPQNFVIKEATFQTHEKGPTFRVPIPMPASTYQDTSLQRFDAGVNAGVPHQQQFQGAYPYYYHDYIEEIDNRPLIDKLIDPLRRVGERVREGVISPVLDAGERLSDRIRLPERVDKIANGNVDADAVPLVGGAVAVAALGALGAYAATKYSLDDIRNLLPQAATRSTKSNANVQDILLKLADDLENEDQSFLQRFTASTEWLESSCAKRIFCSVVTSTMREEAEKIAQENVKKEFEKDVTTQASEGEGDPLQSREARRFFEREVGYLENQINSLINNFKVDISGGKNKSLRQSAKDIVNAVRNRNCSAFTCTKKN